jgi:hypothetical protein
VAHLHSAILSVHIIYVNHISFYILFKGGEEIFKQGA